MVKKKKSVYDAPIEIRFRGSYDYDGLIRLIRGYFGRHLFDKKEPKFKFKTGGSGSEVEFKMIADRKLTHYIKAYIRIDGHLWDVNMKEVMIDGKKEKRTNGKLEIKISGEFELDYKKRFATRKEDKLSPKMENKIERWMQRVLDEDNVGLQFEDNKATGKSYLKKALTQLGDEIKEFLNMECY